MFGRYLSRKGIDDVKETGRTTAQECLTALKGGAFSPRGRPISEGPYRDHRLVYSPAEKALFVQHRNGQRLSTGRWGTS
jgi:hypothetical protein